MHRPDRLQQYKPLFMRGLNHSLRLRGVERERFLAKHVLAVFQRTDCLLIMRLVGTCDIDRVDVGTGKKLLLLSKTARNATLPGIGHTARFVAGTDGANCAVLALLCCLAEPIAHEACPDDANA